MMGDIEDEYGEIIGVIYGRGELETCEVEEEVWGI